MWSSLKRSGFVNSRGGHTFNRLQFCWFQMEIKDVEVQSHVISVGGSGQRQHSDIECKSKNNLADRPPMALCDLDQLGTGYHIAIAGQQREALVSHITGRTELADVAIPAANGVTPVLDEAGADASLVT